MKKNKIIIILLLILIILSGYIVYEKVLNKNNKEEKVVNEMVLSGTYNNKSENDYSYHDATLIVSNEKDTSIDFELSAVHGIDIEHVNIGEVKGTATKIKTNKYEFKEEIDDKESKISFEFLSENNIQSVRITELYPDNMNPYAGHNVYFAGKYNKVY